MLAHPAFVVGLDHCDRLLAHARILSANVGVELLTRVDLRAQRTNRPGKIDHLFFPRQFHHPARKAFIFVSLTQGTFAFRASGQPAVLANQFPNFICLLDGMTGPGVLSLICR